ncbi:hypothetical protein CAOG_009935 [Capsaspora owczarzaki ATCC 30864]|uniref:Reverse transcriptase domain-containing protein n=1 Tax=Capsaspora owczarzaki (strain ATCC 30864) TaxID=595528 RepID=A0A0D2WUE7_CAPO3|nr:hypothetical protein CAOG_009935 [Capsaspora owczarzaki ATCC 30864]
MLSYESMSARQRELYDKVKNANERFLQQCENIDDAGAQAIAEGLKGNPNVEKLFLGWNQIGDAGARAIAETLKLNMTLTNLYLTENQIGDAGALAIAETLRVNTTVTDLGLWQNQIGDAGAQAIAETLKVNKTLIKIEQGNQIGDAGAQAIAEALKVNTTLANLGLHNNKLGDAGATAIAEMLKVNKMLTSLGAMSDQQASSSTRDEHPPTRAHPQGGLTAAPGMGAWGGGNPLAKTGAALPAKSGLEMIDVNDPDYAKLNEELSLNASQMGDGSKHTVVVSWTSLRANKIDGRGNEITKLLMEHIPEGCCGINFGPHELSIVFKHPNQATEACQKGIQFGMTTIYPNACLREVVLMLYNVPMHHSNEAIADMLNTKTGLKFEKCHRSIGKAPNGCPFETGTRIYYATLTSDTNVKQVIDKVPDSIQVTSASGFPRDVQIQVKGQPTKCFHCKQHHKYATCPTRRTHRVCQLRPARRMTPFVTRVHTRRPIPKTQPLRRTPPTPRPQRCPASANLQRRTRQVPAARPRPALPNNKMVKVATWNVRSLKVNSNSLKENEQTIGQQQLKRYMGSLPSLVCLQETRLLTTDEKKASAYFFKYHCFWSSNDNDNDKQAFDPLDHPTDQPSQDDANSPEEGHADQDSHDEIELDTDTNEYVETRNHGEEPALPLIMAGDFNITMDNTSANRTSNSDTTDSVQGRFRSLLSRLNMRDLLDEVDRKNAPLFTWERASQGKTVGSRIDFIFTSEAVQLTGSRYQASHNSRSDHAPVVGEYCHILDKPRPQAPFRLNDTLLNDPCFDHFVVHEARALQTIREPFEWEFFKARVRSYAQKRGAQLARARKQESELVSRKLRVYNGQEATEPDQIANTLRDFLGTLYASEPTTQEDIDTVLEAARPSYRLTSDEQSKLGAPLTDAEIRLAIERTPKGRSPGPDGLTPAFYAKYAGILAAPLAALANVARDRGRLPESMMRGHVKVLYKKGDRASVENYRPISLLNVDCKIISRALCNRLAKVLSKIIPVAQNGFVPGRTIDANIHLFRDILDLTRHHKIPGLAVLLDSRKAFDRVAHDFLYQAMAAYSIGDSFISWMRLLNTGCQSHVVYNATVSLPFPIQRSVRQGSVEAPFLYAIYAGVISDYIQSRRNIAFLNVRPQLEPLVIKASLFADDTTIFVRNDKDVMALFKHYETVGRASNLAINQEKTTIVPLGPRRNDEIPEVFKSLGVEWIDRSKTTRVLGVMLGYGDIIKDNYEPALAKAERALHRWSSRGLHLHVPQNKELKTSPGFHKLWGNALAIEPDSTLQKMILVLCDDQNVVSTPDIISGLQMFD